MEFHFVLLRALALCYPAVFHVHERRPCTNRRSARVAVAGFMGFLAGRRFSAIGEARR